MNQELGRMAPRPCPEMTRRLGHILDQHSEAEPLLTHVVTGHCGSCCLELRHNVDRLLHLASPHREARLTSGTCRDMDDMDRVAEGLLCGRLDGDDETWFSDHVTQRVCLECLAILLDSLSFFLEKERILEPVRPAAATPGRGRMGIPMGAGIAAVVIILVGVARIFPGRETPSRLTPSPHDRTLAQPQQGSRFENRLAESRANLERGRAEEALSGILALRNEHPDNPELIMDEADCRLSLGQQPLCDALLKEAEMLARKPGDEGLHLRIRYRVACRMKDTANHERERLEGARAEFRDIYRQATDGGSRLLQGLALERWAWCDVDLGDRPAGIALLKEAREHSETDGENAEYVALRLTILNSLGELARREDQPRERGEYQLKARTLVEGWLEKHALEAEGSRTDLPLLKEIGFFYDSAGRQSLEQGYFEAAKVDFTKERRAFACARFEAGPGLTCLSWANWHLFEARAQGSESKVDREKYLEASESEVRKGLAILSRAGWQYMEARALRDCALILAERGKRAEAREKAVEALALFRTLYQPLEESHRMALERIAAGIP